MHCLTLEKHGITLVMVLRRQQNGSVLGKWVGEATVICRINNQLVALIALGLIPRPLGRVWHSFSTAEKEFLIAQSDFALNTPPLGAGIIYLWMLRVYYKRGAEIHEA